MRKITKILAILFAFVLSFSTLACSGDENDGGKTKLYVSVFKAGYGITWLEEWGKAYEAEHPNVKVVTDGNAQMDSEAQSAIESGNPDAASDIYTVNTQGDMYRYAVNGLIENLDDIFDDEIQDGKTLEELVDPYAIDSVKVKGNYYGVPCFAAVTGIAYNVDMFEKNGWSVPETMTEFYALCNTIASTTNIYPIAYAGGAGDGYMKSFFDQLSFQYDGMQAYEDFYKFESADVYKTEGRYKAYETIGRIINGSVGSGNSSKTWCLPGSKGNDHLATQRAFIKGECAMMFTGSWLKTEMKEFLEDYPNFRCALMPTPWISDSKTSLDGNTQNTNYSDSTRFVIPSCAKNKELAKDFLKFVSTKEMLQVYAEQTGGSPRPFNYDNVDLSALDEWGTSVMNIFKTCKNVYGISENEYWLKGDLYIMLANNRTICTAFNSTGLMTLAQVQSKAQSLVDSDYLIASNFIK